MLKYYVGKMFFSSENMPKEQRGGLFVFKSVLVLTDHSREMVAN